MQTTRCDAGNLQMPPDDCSSFAISDVIAF